MSTECIHIHDDRGRDIAYVCGPGEIGPQCGHVSFLAAMEYGPKGVPMHVHRNADGTWRETAWGSEADCTERKQAAQ